MMNGRSEPRQAQWWSPGPRSAKMSACGMLQVSATLRAQASSDPMLLHCRSIIPVSAGPLRVRRTPANARRNTSDRPGAQEPGGGTNLVDRRRPPQQRRCNELRAAVHSGDRGQRGTQPVQCCSPGPPGRAQRIPVAHQPDLADGDSDEHPDREQRQQPIGSSRRTERFLAELAADVRDPPAPWLPWAGDPLRTAPVQTGGMMVAVSRPGQYLQ